MSHAVFVVGRVPVAAIGDPVAYALVAAGPHRCKCRPSDCRYNVDGPALSMPDAAFWTRAAVVPGSCLMWRRSFQPGNWVVFRRTKFTTHPGPRAKDIQASEHGDYYNYVVDKFWIVDEVLPDRSLKLRTRRGKTHVVRADDPNLRRASLWERLRYRARFVELGSAERPG